MAEFTDIARLAAELRERIEGRKLPLIGVDGAYGSGKTTLSRGLATHLDAGVLTVDNYALHDGRPYRQQLGYEEIKRDLTVARKHGKPVIVDSLCLLHVLSMAEAVPDVIVYVKRMDPSGQWCDQDFCDPTIIELADPMLNLPGSDLDREMASYHLEKDPLAKADVVFLRIEP